MMQYCRVCLCTSGVVFSAVTEQFIATSYSSMWTNVFNIYANWSIQNNNNNNHDNVYGAVIMTKNNHDSVYGAIILTKVIARVYPLHLMNVDWASGVRQPSDRDVKASRPMWPRGQIIRRRPQPRPHSFSPLLRSRPHGIWPRLHRNWPRGLEYVQRT